MPGGKQARARMLRGWLCANCPHTAYDHVKYGIFGWFVGLGSCNYEDGCDGFVRKV